MMVCWKLEDGMVKCKCGLQVMSHPGVDYTRTVSNHIIDIIDVLGIEAARAALLKVPQLSSFPCTTIYKLPLL